MQSAIQVDSRPGDLVEEERKMQVVVEEWRSVHLEIWISSSFLFFVLLWVKKMGVKGMIFGCLFWSIGTSGYYTPSDTASSPPMYPRIHFTYRNLTKDKSLDRYQKIPNAVEQTIPFPVGTLPVIQVKAQIIGIGNKFSVQNSFLLGYRVKQPRFHGFRYPQPHG